MTTDALATCAGKPAQPSHSIGIARMVGLDSAAKMLGGQQQLADALDINVRSVRAKLTAERGVSDGDLRSAAAALEDRARRLTDHARKLRDLTAS